ncbi:piezo type mechanosensitive ion channel component isoform X1 [Leptinotarsa decemlineata]|uniref:piezo type mechanosensitive ion channel component isoform X1 n=1 Tax=Leptinotarsa decemlineata TaxID=7539 RepID=UPI003D307E86
MSAYILNALLFRILLPIIITSCVIFRPSGLSSIYLLVLCYLPFVPVPTTSTIQGHTGLFLKILIAISVLTSLCQLTFQIVLLLLPPYAHFLKEDLLLEKILRHVGFVRLNDISIVPTIIWLAPEVIMFLASIIFFIVLKKLNPPPGSLNLDESQSFVAPRHKTAAEYVSYAVGIGRYGVLAMLCLAAIVKPSVTGGLYFLIFLSSATWWASYKQLGRGFAIVLCCLLPIVFLHICGLYAYQFQWSQEILPSNSSYVRYFGLTAQIIVDEAEQRDYIFAQDLNWDSFVNPLVLYLLYMVLILESRELLKVELQKKQGAFSRLEGSFTGELGRQMSQRLRKQQLLRSSATKKWQRATRKVRIGLELENEKAIEIEKAIEKVNKEPTERTPLIRGATGGPKRLLPKKSGLTQDSTGSVTITAEIEDIALDDFGENSGVCQKKTNLNSLLFKLDEEEHEAHWFENVIFVLGSILQIIVRSSYIVTNIIMMAWSITYLSWVTFVLLLWANLIWLIPNQRKNMLHSSPFLVIYAWFLLIAGYVYSMNLTEDEIPSKIEGVDLSEIGFVKISVLPCVPLFVKCLYTVMFWVTLRQYMQERVEAKQSSALADMVAPLQVTVGTAAGVKNEKSETGNKIMERIGQFMKQFFTKFWIWVVAITLFAVAITGERMTVFRIVYMALFLFFILSFQFSFRVWRKVMFGFWLTVIIYSMIILVLVYTYQFKNFPSYWTTYLHIPTGQQFDIGLEQYKTKQLFVRLVTPTFFVIVTVIQLHYFHNDFMVLSDPKNTSVVTEEITAEDADQSSLQGGAYIDRSGKEDRSSSVQYNLYELGHMSSIQFQHLAQEWLKKLHRVKNLIFLFMELHMIKIVFLFAMLMAIHDKCATYFIVVALIPVAFSFGRPMQIVVIYATSLLASLMLLLRMIYQIQYINPGNWNVTCQVHNNPLLNETVTNIAPWLGFRKTEEVHTSLIDLVQWNIIYIVIVTLWSVILVRQYNYRMSRGRPTTRAFFMFPNVTIVDSNKDLENFCKYMANFAFYKFGVEISLIMTVVLIGMRMDGYAVLYGMWLVAMFSLERKTLAKVWVFYLIFIACALPFQYFMAVGLPPVLCQEFPWDFPDPIMRGLQDWAFLLDNYEPPPVKKLIYDFLVLLLVSRQWVVFRIEKRYESLAYAGGSNESVIHQAEQTEFDNPVPDFITYVRSYLDILKRAVLQSFLWITLALLFIAGTNRVNLFSIGYLLGAFVFLWHGSDFYLKPIPKILRQWQFLLGYNVTVIFLKTCFQLLGCVFLHYIPVSCCFLIQLLGIGCVRKFTNATDPLTPNVKEDIADSCEVPSEFMGIAWDTICFGFLIFQRRIFNSYNFFHIIDDTKATTILASRGAVLIEEMRMKTMQEQDEMERRVLEKIKMKMDRIKANQQKIQGDRVIDNHYTDSIFSGRPKYRVKPPVTYKQAIRSGDYYMFDELEDEDIDLLPEEKTLEEEDKGAKPDMVELLATAFKNDVNSALRRSSVSQANLMLRRQQSMPLTRKKSARSQYSAAFSAPPTIEEHEPRSVRIQEIPEIEPKPGTSKDEEFSELSDLKETIGRKIMTFLLFIWAFIDSGLVSLTNFLNKYSRNYRYVLKILAKEKRVLKEKTHYNVGVRLGPNQIWQPAGSYHSLLKRSIRRSSLVPQSAAIEAEELSQYDQPTIFRLMLAIWYTVLSRSEILCYFVIFLNQTRNSNFISLPLPLMVFFWGSLTIPRPTKTFWVTIIAYTEVIVLLKCLFQFDIMPGNTMRSKTEYTSTISENNPFYPPTIIGLRRMDSYYALWDLFLLLVVFFHRVLLKSMGIWSSSAPVTAALLSDGDYKLDNGELVPLSASSPNEERGQDLASTSKSVRTVTPVSDKSNNSQDDDTIVVKVRRVEKIKHLSLAVRMALAKYADHFKLFIQQLLDPASRVPADVYTLMFLCDFVNFFVILFGYSSFGTQQDGGVSDYLQDNRVPGLFLFMLILQFMLIVIDRGIYLRKNILGKLIFQFTTIIFLHIWLFILFPVITGRQCNAVVPPQIYYMMKCFYLLFSAYQIRCGYPTRILGNFLCKGYGYVNMFLFRGFMLVPFLFELRTCMDWMWTETSMTIFDWIKMEDIYSHIFLLKCSRHVEDEYPQPRGEKKKPFIKYLMGGAMLTVIIGIIWFPLVFFSLGNAVGEANLPSDVTIELRIGPYEPVYKMSAQSNSIFEFSPQHLEDMRIAYNAFTVSETFIYNYEAVDIAAVKLSSDSANIWGISPPDRKRMVAEIESSNDLKVRLDFKVSHKTSKPEDSGILSGFTEIKIPPSSKTNDTSRENLLKMLAGEKSDPVHLAYLLPKFLKVTSQGTVTPVDVLMMERPVIQAKQYRNVTLRLLRPKENGNGPGSYQEWWHVQEECGDYNDINILEKLPYADCAGSIVLYTFNDKVFPPTLNFITAGGILALYGFYFFFLFSLIRSGLFETLDDIWLEDMPSADRIHRICMEVYLCRDMEYFDLEEELFSQLIFIMRSREICIKLSRSADDYYNPTVVVDLKALGRR